MVDDNEIEEFPLFDGSAGRCKSLRSLRVCRNGTISLNVDGHFPRLETLYADGNCLTHVQGLEHLRHLRTFAARDQMLSSDADAETCVSNLVRNCDVRNLYISLNPTFRLDISQHLLNLQRLEIASMGLKELPDNFGQLTPNIRSINLNFNSIKDLRPLLNIKRLDELSLAGNKLERLRANAMVLGKIGTLSKLDWRDNPLTLRFYASTSENRVMSLRQKPSDEQLTDRFVLPDGDAEADYQHLSRLDYETRIRRRVTEMMLANLCKNLRELDGLKFDKARVLVKDDIWERMLLLGVIQRKQMGKADNDHSG
jgi:Leucine-rich repeat (LRR) protein